LKGEREKRIASFAAGRFICGRDHSSRPSAGALSRGRMAVIDAHLGAPPSEGQSARKPDHPGTDDGDARAAPVRDRT
jgi:hypothetical protein